MCKAWPRFLPEPSTDAIAHALIIEAYAIVVEQLADGHASLGEAHDRALSFAEARRPSGWAMKMNSKRII